MLQLKVAVIYDKQHLLICGIYEKFAEAANSHLKSCLQAFLLTQTDFMIQIQELRTQVHEHIPSILPEASLSYNKLSNRIHT